jgi:hypothetical protein
MRTTALTFALAFGALAAAAPAQAANKDCASEMKRVEAAMPSNLDAGKSDMLRAEMKIAAEKAAQKDEKGCMEHVQKAEKAMK